MAFEFCTSQAVKDKAGVNVSTDITGDILRMNANSDATQGTMNIRCRVDWITNKIKNNFSGALADACSSHIAMKLINHDMASYPLGLTEAQSMLNLNSDIYEKNMRILEDKENQVKFGVDA